MLMIRPSVMTRAAARLQKKVPLTFTDRMRSHASSVRPSRFLCSTNCVVPALFTKISRRPHSWTTRATISLASWSRETSALTVSARRPCSRMAPAVASASPCDRL